MAHSKEIKLLIRFRAKEELTIYILKLLRDFKSKEEPSYTITEEDKINILANIIAKKTL